DGRSGPAVGAKAEAERLDALARALHLGNLLAIPPGAFPDEARPIEPLVQIARRVEDFALLVAHPCGVARRGLEAEQAVVGGGGDDPQARELDRFELLDDRPRVHQRLALGLADTPAVGNAEIAGGADEQHADEREGEETG